MTMYIVLAHLLPCSKGDMILACHFCVCVLCLIILLISTFDIALHYFSSRSVYPSSLSKARYRTHRFVTHIIGVCVHVCARASYRGNEFVVVIVFALTTKFTTF
jgi:hypothetical protein